MKEPLFLATHSQYLDHLEPIYLACKIGHFLVSRELEGFCKVRQLNYQVWDEDDVRQLQGEGPIVVAGYGNLHRVRGRVNRPLVLIEHGSGQTYGNLSPVFADGGERHGVHLALVPGPHPAAGYARATPWVKVVQMGLPRQELLRQRSAVWPRETQPTVAFSFHWAPPGVPTIPELAAGWIYWMPAIAKLRQQIPNLKILGHGHPTAWPILKKIWEGLGVETVDRLEEVMGRAHVYCVDNSSSAFEFASVTGRPILLLDHPDWRTPSTFGLRFGVPGSYFRHCKSDVDLPRDIQAALREGMQPEEVTQRGKGLDLIYQPRTGGDKIAAAAILALNE